MSKRLAKLWMIGTIASALALAACGPKKAPDSDRANPKTNVGEGDVGGPAPIPGQFGKRPSTAVTVGVTLDVPESDEPERFTLTAHVFDTDGEWSWVIGRVDYAAYMTGNCPAQG